MENSNSQAGININTPIRFQDELPDKVDLVVVGGGVIGIFSALYAQRAGLKTLVLEKGRVAGEQSSRNWGWLRQQGRDADELPIVMEANRLWGEVDKQVNGKTGFVRGGCFYLARKEERLNTFSEWMEIAKQHQLETHLLSAKDLAKHIDHTAGAPSSKDSPWIGGIWTPSDARAEPWTAVSSIAELARSEGVSIVENCAVRTLDLEAGVVQGIVTELGPVKCEQLVLAAGAWSSLFLRRHGCTIPQLSFHATVAATEPLPNFMEGMAIDEGLAIRRRVDGGYSIAGRDPVDVYLGQDVIRSMRPYFATFKSSLANPRFNLMAPSGFPDSWGIQRNWSPDEITPFEKTRVLDPKPNMKSVSSAADQFVKLFSGIGRPKIKSAWSGMIDTMPDIVPIVDRVPDLDGVILATGMSGHGFGLGPGVGKVVAEMAVGRSSSHNLQRFRYSRFSDGSKIMVGPGV